ncbi:MAG: hypothetical protein L6R38_001623 [Xanthoria sp. 2 TBL-2021]|nr:MAG: hypothetical protein L6R38_001623 [Xanthoria sp. 2 TBL-2021]
MAKFQKWVRAKLKLSKKTESNATDGPTVDMTTGGSKAEPAESENPIARPADRARNAPAMTGTLAFLSSSDVTVKPKRTRRITQLHERYIESLISEHDGSAQKALLWATQYDKRYVVTRLLANGIPDATSNRFRRCLTFAIRRDDSELLVKFLDTARDKVGLLPTVLGDLPFLKLLVKDADPVVTELYLDCLSVQFRTEIIRAAIEREDFAFLARILPMCKGNDLRESILQDVGFLVLAGKYVACATGVFQLLLQGLNEEDRERMRSRFREGVPASIVAHTLSAGLNKPRSYQSPSAKPDKSSGPDTKRTSRKGLWPDRVDTDPKTKQRVEISPMEPYYWN